MDMGMKMKLIRIEKRLKQYEMAEMLGISREYLRRIENNTAKNPSIPIMKKISEILEISVQELFFD